MKFLAVYKIKTSEYSGGGPAGVNPITIEEKLTFEVIDTGKAKGVAENKRQELERKYLPHTSTEPCSATLETLSVVVHEK